MRHRQRHVHKTILEYVRTGLTAYGWMTDPAPFGGPKVTLIDYEPISAGETPEFNTVAVSIGNQGEDKPFELGAGLYETRYAMFVDVFPTNEAVGVALAEDLKDLLSEEVITLRDWTHNPAGDLTTDQIEFEYVLVEVIPTATTTVDKRSWRSVKATACLYFS